MVREMRGGGRGEEGRKEKREGREGTSTQQGNKTRKGMIESS